MTKFKKTHKDSQGAHIYSSVKKVMILHESCSDDVSQSILGS